MFSLKYKPRTFTEKKIGLIGATRLPQINTERKSLSYWLHGSGPGTAPHVNPKNGFGIYVFHKEISMAIFSNPYNPLI